MALQSVTVCVFLVCMISVAFACEYGSGSGGDSSGGGSGGNGGSSGPSSINAAVISNHVFKIKNFVSSSQNAQIPTIIIGSGNVALPIKMLSSSSDIEISQEHNNAAPQTLNDNSIDGTIVLNHFVKKPILQNVREVIIPQQKIVQEVMPVKEFIKTIVAQEDSSSSGGDSGSSGGSGTSAPESDDSY